MSTQSIQQRTKAIERNAQEFSEYENLLIFGPPANDDLTYLTPKKVITFDYRVFLSHQAALNEAIEFSISSTEKAVYDAALVFLPKSKWLHPLPPPYQRFRNTIPFLLPTGQSAIWLH